MSADSRGAVDLVVNVFERTYRRALEPGAIAAIAQANRFAFARRTVLVNNVDDRADAQARAQALLADGEIDELHFIADRLDGALRAVDLRRGELEPLLHYSDGPLVAVTLPGSPWLLYWDPEARLAEPVDWVTPALELIGDDARVIVANPSWEAADAAGRRAGVEHEASETRGGFALGEGFSDQVFLASRAALAAPIYSQRCIVRLSYPGAHKAHVFEARLAAHMRHHGRLRATSLTATYETDAPSGRSSYPPKGMLEAVRYARNALALRALSASPWRPRCLRRSWV
ncbi:MAG TPA: hypothetical protein VN892_15600 [Solirubrobacteraceae bacterium]|nr:hypothetical protein [Solirubrobacteraceae bacterium]